MIARKLEDAALAVVATPAYIATRGIPDSIEALRDHACIQFVLPGSGKPIPRLFRENGKNLEVATEGRYFCYKDALGPVTLARGGAELFQSYRFIVEEDLRQGMLVEVLQPLSGCSRPYSLLYAHGRHISLRVRSFLDFLIKALAGYATNSRLPSSQRPVIRN